MHGSSSIYTQSCPDPLSQPRQGAEISPRKRNWEAETRLGKSVAVLGSSPWVIFGPHGPARSFAVINKAQKNERWGHMWCQYTLIKCNNSPFPEVDVLRQISRRRFMPGRGFLGCAEHQCPLWEHQDSAGICSSELFHTSTFHRVSWFCSPWSKDPFQFDLLHVKKPKKTKNKKIRKGLVGFGGSLRIHNWVNNSSVGPSRVSFKAFCQAGTSWGGAKSWSELLSGLTFLCHFTWAGDSPGWDCFGQMWVEKLE